MRRIIPLVLCLLVLSGCSPQPLPEGMDEEEVLTAGRAVVELLVAGDYEAVYDQLRPDVQETASAQAIGQLMEDAASEAGVYLGRKDEMVSGRTVDGVEYGEALIMGEFREDDVLFRLSFDTDLVLVGLGITKQ